MTKQTFVLSCAACLVAGYLLAAAPGVIPFNPLDPFKPKDRPVARLLAKLAKLGLWVAVFAEQRPERNPEYARACANGEMICHAEGW